MADPLQPISPSQYQLVSMTGPLGAAPVRPDAVSRVAIEPSPLLYDTFDAGLDTTVRWTAAGTVPPTASAGLLTIGPSMTAALATSWLVSQAVMPLTINSFVTPNMLIVTDAALKTGTYRFAGLGIPAASPTVAAPIVNGVGFEWSATTGVLSGVVWSAGTRTQSVSLASVQPLDSANHRYLMYYKSSRVYFEIDAVSVGSIAYPAPAVTNLPELMLNVNGASTVSPAAVFNATFLGVADSAHDNMFISDGQYPWRKAKVTAAGEQRVTLGNPSILQKASAVSTGSVATLASTFGVLNTSGGTVLVSCAVGNATNPTVTDTNGNTYTLVKAQTVGAAATVAVFSASNVLAPALNTVTVTNGGAAASMAMEIYEVDALLAASLALVDASASATATSTAPATAALQPIAPNELMIFAVGVGTAAQTITPAAGLVNDSGQLNPTTPAGLFSFASFSQFLGSTAPITPSATIVSEPWAAVAVTFRPAMAGVEGSFRITDGTSNAAVKAASTPVALIDPALNTAQSPFSYNHIAGAATPVVKASPGVLHSVTVNTKGTTATATIFDNTAASGTVIAVLDLTVSQTTLIYDVAFATGLALSVTGTLSDITVAYK